MNYLKMISKSLIYIVSIILISTIIVTLFNYINFFNVKVLTVFKIIIPILSMFIGGFMVGKKAKQKGWLEGLKLGLIVLGLIILISLILLRDNFEARNIIFYLILLTATIFGSMVGKAKELENN